MFEIVGNIFWHEFCILLALLLHIGISVPWQDYYRGSPTSMVSTSTISTSTNFQKVLHKVVLVGDLISKFILVVIVLVETILVGDPL